MEFCKVFNADTSGRRDDQSRWSSASTRPSFTYIKKSPPPPSCCRSGRGDQGLGEPIKEKVGKVSSKQVEEIARLKLNDLNAMTWAAAVRIIEGTAAAWASKSRSRGDIQWRRRGRSSGCRGPRRSGAEVPGGEGRRPGQADEVHQFDETVDVASSSGWTPRRPTRWSALGGPAARHGKSVAVLVFAKGEKEKEAQDAGAEFVAPRSSSTRSQKGWDGFRRRGRTRPISWGWSASSAGCSARAGSCPTPRRAPSPSTWPEPSATSRPARWSTGWRRAHHPRPVGKVSFEEGALVENFRALMESVMKSKPSTSKGHLSQGDHHLLHHGPGVKLDVALLQTQL